MATSEALATIDLTDCICLGCGSEDLSVSSVDGVEAIFCQSCSARYDILAGLPCLTRYKPEETLSLIEILANVDEKRTPPTKDKLKEWADILHIRHTDPNWEETLSDLSPSVQKFLPNRYRQYSTLKTLSDGMSFEGAHVLDAGAGEGFDAFLLREMGAKVTTAEFNPLLCLLGRNAVDAHWIAASAHALPFKDETFDYVICQAALHHMLSVSDAVREFLRVVKVNGAIFTISDSYRAESAGIEFEINRFNKDAAVLRGINESIPSIKDFVSSLDPYLDSVDVSLYTSRVFNFRENEGGPSETLEGPRMWRYPDDYGKLAQTSGGVSMSIRKRRAVELPGPRLPDPVVYPRAFLNDVVYRCDGAAAQASKQHAMAQLARHIPEAYCDLPFPGPEGNTKFELLNGWMKRREGQDGKYAYVRARRFFTRNVQFERLSVSLIGPSSRSIVLEVFIDALSQGTLLLSPEHEVGAEFSLAHVTPGAKYSVEFRILEIGPSFESNVFEVRQIRFS